MKNTTYQTQNNIERARAQLSQSVHIATSTLVREGADEAWSEFHINGVFVMVAITTLNIEFLFTQICSTFRTIEFEQAVSLLNVIESI